jgi:hypothetical protein
MLTLVFYSRFIESNNHILPKAELEEQVQQDYEAGNEDFPTAAPPPSQAATIPAKADLLKGIFLGSILIRIVSRIIRFGLLGGLCS